MTRAAEQLGSENSYFDLRAMFYDFGVDASTGRRRLTITDDVALGKSA